MALLSRGEPTAISIDGLSHLDRLGLGVYQEAGEISQSEIEQLAAHGEWKVDYQGETRLVQTPQGPAREIRGIRRAPLWACVLGRQPGAEPAAQPTDWESVIQLAEAEPTVVTREDALRGIRWQLLAIAEERGGPIPPPDVLDRLAEETLRLSMVQGVKVEDAALAGRSREIGERQRRNDLCRCGSGKKYRPRTRAERSSRWTWWTPSEKPWTSPEADQAATLATRGTHP